MVKSSTVITSLYALFWGRGLFARKDQASPVIYMRITKKHLRDLKSASGGYSKKQVAIMKEISPNKRFAGLVGMFVTDEKWEQMLNAKNNRKTSIKNWKKKKSQKHTQRKNDLGWAWKDSEDTGKRVLVKPKQSDNDFYESKPWRALRVRVLEKHGGCCMLCGRSYREHKVVIHVDHIKPRSKYPHLELEYNNLQILCADCNIGKGNKYETDWRPNTK